MNEFPLPEDHDHEGSSVVAFKKNLFPTSAALHKSDSLYVFFLRSRWLMRVLLRPSRHPSYVYEGNIFSLYVPRLCDSAVRAQQLKLAEVNVSLFPWVEVRLHHVHKVTRCFVSIPRHVNDGESFAHFEEVHLLCVTLREKHKDRQTHKLSWGVKKDNELDSYSFFLTRHANLIHTD